MKRPSFETIPGETPVPHKGNGAGGSSYFSSGSVRGSLRRGVWPDAMARRDSKTRQVKKLALETLKHLKLKRTVVTPRYLIIEKRGETSFFPIRGRLADLGRTRALERPPPLDRSPPIDRLRRDSIGLGQRPYYVNPTLLFIGFGGAGFTGASPMYHARADTSAI